MADLMQIHEIRLMNTRDLIEESGLSRTGFAEKIGMSYNLLSQYIGKNPKKRIGDETAEKIETAFNKPKGYLDHINKNNDFEKPLALDNNIDLSQKLELMGRPIPVISWVQAGPWTGIDSVPEDTEFDEWLPPNKDCGKNGYALVVKGLSMYPRFEPEDRIYVNPDFPMCDLKTDDLVIVCCPDDTEATFKKLIIEGNQKYLQPLNPDWPEQIMKLPKGCRLVGKVVGQYRKI